MRRMCDWFAGQTAAPLLAGAVVSRLWTDESRPSHHRGGAVIRACSDCPRGCRCGPCFLTDGPSRKVQIGRRQIVLKNAALRQMATASRVTGTVIQASRWIGQR